MCTIRKELGELGGDLKSDSCHKQQWGEGWIDHPGRILHISYVYSTASPFSTSCLTFRCLQDYPRQPKRHTRTLIRLTRPHVKT
jgi:hypothetical protein